MPVVSRSDLLALRKTETVVVRMTKRDKALLFATAKNLRLTATEFLTLVARMAAEKLEGA